MQPNQNPQNQQKNSSNVDNIVIASDNNNQDGYFEIIDRQQLIPMNDTNCKHERYIEDPEGSTEEYISMVCSNPKCPVGYLVAR